LYYKELLRVRHFFVYFAGTIAAIALVCMVIPNRVLSLGAGAHPQIPFVFFLVVAGIAASILATILGTSLAAENCAHLEIAWTLPASRIAYAARVLWVDVLAIVALFAFIVLAGLAVIYAHGFGRYLVFDPDSGAEVLRFAAYPLAWFGIAQALTASMRAKAPAYAGLAWPVALALLILYEVPLSAPLHAMLRTINLVNPLVYASFASGTVTPDLLMLNAAIAAEALAGLAILGIALALAQWQRLQA